MRPFRDQSIARKTLTLGLVPTVVALVVAIIASLLSTYVTARRNQRADVESQAHVVADNVSAGLAFADKEVVDDVVEAFEVRPNIDLVCVYDADGMLFSTFHRPGQACPGTWPAATPAAAPVAIKTATASNKAVGTVYIRGNYSNLLSWMRTQSAVAAFALVCGIFAAIVITRFLQRYLAAPIVDLATTLDRVSAGGDYSTRAERRTGDEVGRLVDSFNTMLGVIEKKDVERNELLQKSEESNRIKDEFLATVSHELRTPLNAMLGWLQIIRSTDVDRDVFERALGSIERNARSQARLVEDLIELSRVVTGKLQLKTKPVDLRTAIEAALDVVRTAAAAKGVAIRTTLPTSAVMVSGDRDRLQQIAWNLLSNSVKFTESGGAVDVNVSAAERYVSVVITDTGIGISPDFLPFVFDRFRQADQSTTREHGGLGLGLAIAKHLVELHGGSIQANSEGPGMGTVVSIRLPVAAGLKSANDPESPQVAATFELQNRTLLIVDDQADSREMIAALLEQRGATILQCESAAAALDLLSTEHLDLLIADIAMPGIDGYELMRRARSAGCHVPAIAVTAFARSDDRRRALESGYAGYLAKPVDGIQLAKAAHDLLRTPTA